MGCDIHCAWEFKSPDGWQTLDDWEYRSEDSYGSPMGELIGDRNYGMFAVMAGVRNGVGFAGCDMGDALEPIAEPRGIPHDANQHIHAWVDDWGADGHSASYLTLKDLLDYDQSRTVKVRGVVSISVYVEWCRWGRSQNEAPKSYCGGVSGQKVRTLTPAMADVEVYAARKTIDQTLDRWAIETRLVKDLEADNHSSTYVGVEWTETYGHQMGELWSKAAPEMLRVAREKGVSHDDVRLVFFFDN